MKTTIGERLQTFWRLLLSRKVANVRVGPRQTRPDAPAHMPGVSQGNDRGLLRRDRGIRETATGATATAYRSTGISPKARNPIVPGAPVLTPP